MTEEQIKDLEDLDKAATPVPWVVRSMGGIPYQIETPGGGDAEQIFTFERDIGYPKPADIRLAAWARNLVPDLIAEVRRLRLEVERFKKLHDDLAAWDEKL